MTNFKNYSAQRLDCSPVLNCFVGMNGMGKTNLLDAVYYLCMGKSHFSLPDSNLVRHGEDFFRLEGHFVLDEGRREKIVAKVQPRRRKELERNEVPYPRLSDHVGLLPVVFLAPDDTYLVREGSEARRNFLDNTLSQLDPLYLRELITYNRILQQRNALLKQFGEGRSFQASLLEIYDDQLLAPAAYLYEKRLAFMEHFRPILQQTVHTLSSAREEVDCIYESPLHQGNLKDLLIAAREKDRVLERTSTGIHRDDLEFVLRGHSLKKFGSQGQLKSFVLALKLAQYELLRQAKGRAPFLLLDDLFDKLDSSRVEQLLSLLLESSFGPIFLTDTHEERVEEIIRQIRGDYRKFKVENGQITPKGP